MAVREINCQKDLNYAEVNVAMGFIILCDEGIRSLNVTEYLMYDYNVLALP